jgi:hypothetical protein
MKLSVTPDLRLLVAPSETYRAVAQAAAGDPSHAWSRAVARASGAAVIAGITTAAAATGRITWSLALSGALCWSFIAVVQMTAAAAVIAPSTRGKGARQGPSLPRAIELFFFGHAAWSLWLLLSAAFLVAVPGLARTDIVVATAVLPFAWTAVVVFAFFRQVLQLERVNAAIWTAIHQSLTALVFLLYVGWAVQLWPRLLATRIP